MVMSTAYTADSESRTANAAVRPIPKSPGGMTTTHRVSSASTSRGVWVLERYAASRPVGSSTAVWSHSLDARSLMPRV